MAKFEKIEGYGGFEQGPIRPPSEAGSLLIRVSRNCPWNRCSFCPVYKGESFSLRPVEHVLADIDRVSLCVNAIRQRAQGTGRLSQDDIATLSREVGDEDPAALHAALHWASNSMRSVFLQDANSLVIKPADLLSILHHVQRCFPWVERVTSYGRSKTIAKISDHELQAMRQAGLSRIHIGMESGSDRVLARVKKGVDKATHILAGKKVVAAGMELSEYIMPGLGGRDLSREHALESADACNQINPHFIRLRSLAIPNHVELYGQWQAGEFAKLVDREVAEELLLFLDSLEGITSTITSDHILNLFEDVRGTYPEDKAWMTGKIKDFLALPEEERMHYQVGRRMGLFRGLDDMADPRRLARVQEVCRRLAITTDTVDEAVDELMKRFI